MIRVFLCVKFIEILFGEIRAVGLSSAVLKTVGPRGVRVRVPLSPPNGAHSSVG
jgi:hypothetical protein